MCQWLAADFGSANRTPVIDIQKKVAALLGIPLARSDNEP
jgi:hypothetical protein